MLFKKRAPAERNDEKKIRLLDVESVQAANRAEKSIRFLALATDENDSEALLEGLVLAKLLKNNHPGAHTMVLTHRANYRFLRRAGVFDRIYFARETPGSIWKKARRVARFKADLVFSATPAARDLFAVWLAGVPFKLGTRGRTLLGRVLGWLDPSRTEDLERLARREILIQPAGVRLVFPAIPTVDLLSPRDASRAGALAPLGELSDRPFVFLRLNGPEAWPLSYLPRLARLCAPIGLRLVVQLPGNVKPEDRAYLKQASPDTILLSDLSTWQLVTVVGLSEAVIGTGGSEKVLASMLNRPGFVLQGEIQSTESGDERVLQLRGAPPARALLGRIKTRSRILSARSAGEAPAGLDCISPELLFDAMRAVLTAR